MTLLPLLPLLLACASSPERVTLAAPVALVVQDVDVFDPDLPGLVRDQDVLVDGGRIVAVRPTGQPVPPGAEVVPGGGRTLLPGLVDAHVHAGSPVSLPGQVAAPDPGRNMQAWLEAGVTTVMDMGGRAPMTRKAAEADASPRVYAAHTPITCRGGHPLVLGKALLPWPLDAMIAASIPQVDGPEDAPAVVAKTLEAQPAWVKIIVDELPTGTPELSDEALAALISEAHGAGARAVVHVGDEHNALAAIRADADLLVHGIWRGGLSDEGLAELAASDVPVIATLYGYQATADMIAGTWQPTAMDAALGFGEISAELAAGGPAIAEDFPVFGTFAAQIDPDFAGVVRRMHEAGVTVLVGTDAPLPGVWPGSGMHRELAALQAAGIPAAEVLAGATGRTADWLAEDAALGVDFGRVAPGRAADLLLVEGDPTRDVAAAGEIVAVWRGGRRVLPAR